jgi:hypothetical protein
MIWDDARIIAKACPSFITHHPGDLIYTHDAGRRPNAGDVITGASTAAAVEPAHHGGQ